MKKVISAFILAAVISMRLLFSIDAKISNNNTRIRNEIYELKQIAKIDTIRESNITKINKLIDFYNPFMKPMNRHETVMAILEMDMMYDNLDVDLICAVITQESVWKVKAKSKAQAKGLMQIKQATGNWVAKRKNVNLYDPAVNIRIGARYLSDLINKHGLTGGLVAYNSGNKGLEYWKRTGTMFKETSTYVPKVFAYYQDL